MGKHIRKGMLSLGWCGIMTLFRAGDGRMAIDAVIAKQSWYNDSAIAEFYAG